MFRRVNTPAALRERTALVPFPHSTETGMARRRRQENAAVHDEGQGAAGRCGTA